MVRATRAATPSSALKVAAPAAATFVTFSTSAAMMAFSTSVMVMIMVAVSKPISPAIVIIASAAWNVRPRYTAAERHGQRKQNSEVFHGRLHNNWQY